MDGSSYQSFTGAGFAVKKDCAVTVCDLLNKFEHFFKLPVDFGLLVFGLANAGVVMSSVGNATWAVLLALAVGKTVGIFGFAYFATKVGFPLPQGMNGRSLVVVGDCE